MEVAADELRRLERKYLVMVELRASLPPRDGGGESAEDRARLRELAAEFPGALRELDTLSTDELERRRAALDVAAAGGAVEPWMRWMHGYHALMRAALAVKRRLGARAAEISDGEREQITEATGVAVDEALVRAVAAPPHGRLNVIVFERLGALFRTSPKTIWDTLYPARRGERGYRR